MRLFFTPRYCSSDLVGQFNFKFFNDLFSIFDVTPVYITRPVPLTSASRSSPEVIVDSFNPQPIFRSEEIIHVPPLNHPPDFQSIFKDDQYYDNFSSFNNLYFQLETLRLGTQSISLDDYDIVLCYRDDMVLSSKTDLSLEFLSKRALRYFI